MTNEKLVLLSELNEEVNLIVEDKKDDEGNVTDKKYYIEGIIMQANIKNGNGRVYPLEVLQREVESYKKNYIDNGANRAFGELGHPSSMTVNLDRVSHVFKEIRQDGNNFIGKAEVITENPMGKIVKNFIDIGSKLGISTRGAGSIEKRGDTIFVKENFKLATAGDIVANPSGPDCYISGIMEGMEFWYDLAENTWKEKNSMDTYNKIENDVKVIKESYSKLTDKDIVNMFEGFLSTL